MSDTLYRRLQQRLDQYSMGFPQTASGIEINILKHLFSPEDASLFLEMTPRLESAPAVARRLEQSVQGVEDRLEDLAGRGLLFRLKKGDTVRYAAVPFVHGIFEFQINNLEPELVQMVEQYSREGFDNAIRTSADFFLRTVPVQQSLDVTQPIASYDDAVSILKQKALIVVAECICRKRKALVQASCGKPMEACFMFGAMASYYLDRGMGRAVGVDEAIDILTRCQESGLVTQPATSQNPSGMCNCCGDCCGVLEALNKHPSPADLVFSNHYARVDPEACSGCEACLDRCQMNAIRMTSDERAQIDRARCIGCGLCIVTCGSQALRLVVKPAHAVRTPPATNAEQMLCMAQKRGVV